MIEEKNEIEDFVIFSNELILSMQLVYKILYFRLDYISKTYKLSLRLFVLIQHVQNKKNQNWYDETQEGY